MAENDIEALTVEQVDREAAKSLLGRDDAGPSWWSIDSGNADSDPLVQAFASHRLTALRSTTAEPFSRPTDPSEAVWDEWTSHPTDIAAKDAEIAAYREVLVKVRDWCCPVLCINCADNRKAIDIALANRGEAGSLAKEREE